MRFEIQGSLADASAELREYAEQRIGLAVGRFADRIARVVVRFHRMPNPQGAAGLQCKVVVTLIPSGRLTVYVMDPDAEYAVGRAARRAARRLRSELHDRRRMRSSLPRMNSNRPEHEQGERRHGYLRDSRGGGNRCGLTAGKPPQSRGE